MTGQPDRGQAEQDWDLLLATPTMYPSRPARRRESRQEATQDPKTAHALTEMLVASLTKLQRKQIAQHLARGGEVYLDVRFS